MKTRLSLGKLSEFLCLENPIILITENLSGHRSEWLERLTLQNNNIGRKLVVLTKKNSTAIPYDYDSRIEYYECDDFDSLGRILEFLNSAHLRNQPNILIWEADNLLGNLVFAKFNAKCLIMRPYITEWRFRALISFFLKMSLIGILILTNRHSIGLLSIAHSKHRFFPRKWVEDWIDPALLDFVQQNDVLFRKFNDPDSAFKILLPGYITTRKNPQLLVEACKVARDLYNINLELEICGRLEDTLVNSFGNFPSWVKVTNKRLSKEDFWRKIVSANCIVLPYSNRGSSGIVLESLYLGKVVLISSNRNWKHAKRHCDEQLFLARLNKKSISKQIYLIFQSTRVHRPRQVELSRGEFNVFDFLISSIDDKR